VKFYEMRTYTIKTGQVAQYLQHFAEVGLPIISKYAKLVGYWYTDIGPLNQVIHIWEYDSLDQRAEKRKALYNDPEWLANFLPKALPLVAEQHTQIMYAANFSPIK